MFAFVPFFCPLLYLDMEVVVQLVVERTAKDVDLGVSFNGSWPTFAREESKRLLFPTGIYTRHLNSKRAFNYRFKAADVREAPAKSSSLMAAPRRPQQPSGVKTR